MMACIVRRESKSSKLLFCDICIDGSARNYHFLYACTVAEKRKYVSGYPLRYKRPSKPPRGPAPSLRLIKCTSNLSDPRTEPMSHACTEDGIVLSQLVPI